MRVKQSMRGLIVDEGRLNGLIVDEQRLNGLIVDEGRRMSGFGTDDYPISKGAGLALAAVKLGASVLLYRNGWPKLGGFLGFLGATGLVVNLYRD